MTRCVWTHCVGTQCGAPKCLAYKNKLAKSTFFVLYIKCCNSRFYSLWGGKTNLQLLLISSHFFALLTCRPFFWHAHLNVISFASVILCISLRSINAPQDNKGHPSGQKRKCCKPTAHPKHFSILKSTSKTLQCSTCPCKLCQKEPSLLSKPYEPTQILFYYSDT